MNKLVLLLRVQTVSVVHARDCAKSVDMKC
jgi:hypothetical protein